MNTRLAPQISLTSLERMLPLRATIGMRVPSTQQITPGRPATFLKILICFDNVGYLLVLKALEKIRASFPCILKTQKFRFQQFETLKQNFCFDFKSFLSLKSLKKLKSFL